MAIFKAYYRFKPRNRAIKVGSGQVRTGYYQGHGIRIEFTIDAWEATSTSAWGTHLSGGWICTGIFIVRSIVREKGLMTVQATCLALGTGFGEDYHIDPPIAYRDDERDDEDDSYDVTEPQTDSFVKALIEHEDAKRNSK